MKRPIHAVLNVPDFRPGMNTELWDFSRVARRDSVQILRTFSRMSFLAAVALFFFRPVSVTAAELTVAVSANVQFAFEELQTAFSDDTGITVKGIIGSSGKLTSQIENGAPFDVFLSADTGYPDALYAEGLTYNTPAVYVYGTLVLWTLNDVDLSGAGLRIVADATVRKIALPTPKTAPYGRQAVNALKYYGVYPLVEKKLVYGESIAQANQFIVSRSADVGFTAKSVVCAPNMQGQGTWIEIAPEAYSPIAQAAVILTFAAAEHLAEARAFYAFLFSGTAQRIFQKYGYRLPEPVDAQPDTML